MEIVGNVVKKNYAVGSKSEREAVMLHDGDEDILLRRKDGNPFHDEILLSLVGKRIRCKGVRTDWGIIVEDWDEIG